MLLPVVMSGGSGTRLWPLSRKQYPKQFLSLASDNTMFQDTIQRLVGLEDMAAPLVVCNDEHRFIVAEQLRERNYQSSGILLEPVGRNTAPALAVAALHATKNGDDPVMLVLAADHVIKQTAVFHQAVDRARPYAEQGKLITFGIVPDSPEVGYGYIKAGSEIGQYVQEVAEFVEKPNKETAEVYLKQGNYSWNSGMFMFKASTYLAELEKFRPDILQACRLAYKGAHADLDFIRLNEQAFTECPDESVDYAVMEQTQSALVVAMDAGWNDVGSWSALWEVGERDDVGNVAFGDVLSEDSRNSYFYTNDKLVATVGVDNLVVVNTSDAVLVAHKERVQDVKKLVQRLLQSQRSEPIVHRNVYRPWGCYDSVDNGERFQVKRITVKPGAKLSLQMHHHRAEHWIVVSGSANVTIGDKTQFLTENQSAYIPIGATHRLENPGVIPLEMIEVQSGSYLGEDDIVRFEDTYGRAEDGDDSNS